MVVLRIVKRLLLYAYLLSVYRTSFIDGYLTYLAVRMPLKGEKSPPGSPWPMPKEWTPTNEQMTLDPKTFRFTSNIEGCDIVTNAIERYRSLIFGYKGLTKADGLTSISELFINISSVKCGGYPTSSMDESYDLTVNEKSYLRSNEVWGMLRGLETFSQLVYTQSSQIFINKTTVRDRPRFSFRGLHTDTARHFIPLPILKKNLDAMSYNKFNVFHWHIVDDQSFPFESKTFPDLSEKGAFSSKHVYTQEDVAEIIEYARLRGIRVIPEFDSPGHTHSWGKSFPELLTICWVGDKPEVPIWGQYASRENFDVTKEFTYTFLNKFFTEVKDVFRDEYIHLGMDEAYYRCWKSNPNITAWMKENNMGSVYGKLEQYYSERVFDIISKLGRKYVIWQDPVEHGAKVKNDTLVIVWKGGNVKEEEPWNTYMEKIVPQGYNTVVASCWYLNYITYPPNWKSLYSCDPHDFNGTQADKERVIGGETCMWSEYVDGTNILSRYWPRASAVAERLWSPRHLNDSTEAQYRLDEQRCRMVRRGIPAEPILDGFCGDYEWGFGGTDSMIDKGRNSNGHIGASSLLQSAPLTIIIAMLVWFVSADN